MTLIAALQYHSRQFHIFGRGSNCNVYSANDIVIFLHTYLDKLNDNMLYNSHRDIIINELDSSHRTA